MDETLQGGAGAFDPSFDAANAQRVHFEGRDLFIVARPLEPTQAWLLRNVLVAGGVPAVVADNNHVQAYSLLALALGGVRVLVPQEFVAQSLELIAAFERGDFALHEDSDVGEAGV